MKKNSGKNKKSKGNYGDAYNYVDISSGDYIDISSGLEPEPMRIPWKKVFSVAFFALVGVAGGAMIYIYNTLNSFNYDDFSDSPDTNFSYNGEQQNTSATKGEDDLISDNMVLNVMLLGTDKQSVNDKGRSDTMLIVSLDMRHKKVKITSIMRDIWVKIPDHYTDRINTAYSLGGPKLAIETVERNFGIHIDRYASVDFDGFANIVDKLGGIDIELTASEVDYINKYSGDKHTLKGSGMKHLTGLQALHHARNRNSAGSDYDRTERQRNVIITIMNKMKTADLVQITGIISELAPMITTNFKSSEIAKLAANSLTYLNFEFLQFRLPTDDNVRNETIDQKMVLVINDMTKARKDIANFIYEDALVNN